MENKSKLDIISKRMLYIGGIAVGLLYLASRCNAIGGRVTSNRFETIAEKDVKIVRHLNQREDTLYKIPSGKYKSLEQMYQDAKTKIDSTYKFQGERK